MACGGSTGHGAAWHAVARRAVVRCVARGGSTCGGARPLNVAQRKGGVTCGLSAWGGAVARRAVARCVAVGRDMRPLNMGRRGSSMCGGAVRGAARGHSTWRGGVGRGGARRAACGRGRRAWGYEKKREKKEGVMGADLPGLVLARRCLKEVGEGGVACREPIIEA